ncbi:hypothetical protein PVAR5_6819 [Paecilomyces variotii No. 5]|uniref:Zn(2)-C6 fungal-type domain-containing protein n=1 Tax=Byssochlamys spectabilis (strain No. 5 / NBRC 109023) TaxID=1356009 RepID=V5FJU2_BYSSN|nr:hypothetical protein PVAR5_6819 [Paecilomyces variotii No. 5]
MRRDPNGERLRARQACRNCRKKKARCPSERPSCSTCVRLKQSCVYDGTRSRDRLADLEKKVDLLLNGRGQGSVSEPLDDGSPTEPPDASTTPEPSTNLEASSTQDASDALNRPVKYSLAPLPEFSIPNPALSDPIIAHGLDMYFERFHRQPIWCFDRHDTEHSTEVSTELICSILELTTRLSREHGSQRYGERARWSIMLRMADGTVKLETIESLCLLSYSAFIEIDFEQMAICTLANFTSASAFNSAGLQTWIVYRHLITDTIPHGILRTASDAWRPYYLSDTGNTAFPRDLSAASTGSDPGIWTLSVHFGWIWGRVREYVTECSRNKLIEPWRLDSTYAKVLADMTEIENKVPLCHRYHIVKFNERRPDEVQINRDYWMPWLKLQFTWHSILTMINHPFLYIVASRSHPKLAIPNTFWRKSSELVLLHATWIVRTIDMIHEKDIRLHDPFFGHAAAIAATVHLYFCCATDPRLRQKSKADFAKCRRFLNDISSFSPACECLTRLLDKMSRIALASDSNDGTSVPCRVHLSVPLMWSILQFDMSSSKVGSYPKDTSLPTSPSLAGVVEETEQNPTLEISITASPPVIIIDPSLGHDASLPPYKAISAPSELPDGSVMRDPAVPPAESFMFNAPWFCADPFGYGNMENIAYFPRDLTAGNNSEGFSTWWNFGNF